MVRKVCAAPKCNNEFDGHGNAKYCSPWCKNKVRKEQNRLKQRRYRDRQNKGTLVKDSPRNQIGNAALPHQTALEVYRQEAQEEEFFRLLQKALAPQFFEVNNRLARLETNQEEIGHALLLSPQLTNQRSWEEFAIQRAMKLVEACEESLPLYRIKWFLKEVLRTDKRTAERILKEAVERLQSKKDRNQKKLGDFDADLGGK